MPQTTVVIVGANGQVGQELQRASWPDGWSIEALSSADLDITDGAAVAALMAELAPDVIVNAAAYTAVDKAESEEALAFAVNASAVKSLANAADSVEAFLVHISTDYVFDGTKDSSYLESDPLAPIGAYGRSKAEGEKHADSANNAVTLRTAWVYGALGANFVTTMLRLAGERDTIGVVSDQFGCPTSAADIATTIVRIAEQQRSSGPLPSRLYHLVSPDSASWFEVAEAVFASSSKGYSGTLSAITTEQYPTPAARPANSRLGSDRLKDELGIQLPEWRDSLRTVVQELEETK